MKRAMTLGLGFCLLILLIAGCQMKPSLSLLKIEEGAAPAAVQNFVHEQSGRNGVDLYSDGVHGDYLFLNAFNVEQGEKAAYFSEVTCEIVDETLNIYFSENQTDYFNEKINNKVIYKIVSTFKYNTIRVFRNGQEITFDVVGA